MININKATVNELITIVHIGRRRAEAIVNRRNESLFKDLYELSSMKGFGKSRIDDIITEGKLICK
jgi:DNA uptake protein ComE-like DNA-binding protein